MRGEWGEGERAKVSGEKVRKRRRRKKDRKTKEKGREETVGRVRGR